MRIFIPNCEKLSQNIGGGNTFLKNFLQYLPGEVELVDKISECDIFFIVGPSTCSREEYREAKQMGKKVALRLDGIPEDWRNRGTGVSRMIDFARSADYIITQSFFIEDTTLKFIKNRGERAITDKVRRIYNGVDTKIFNKEGADPNDERDTIYLHVHYRKDPNKRFEEVVETMRNLQMRLGKKAEFWLVGRIPTMFAQYNCGLFNGETVKNWGVQADRESLAGIMKMAKYLIYPAYADPAPNTVLEALSCGMEIIQYNEYSGVPEYIEKYQNFYDFSMDRCVKEYMEVFNELL